MSQVTALQDLSLAFNNNLQLKNQDIDILTALSHLRHLDISKDLSAVGWSPESVMSMFAIKLRLTSIELKLAESSDDE